MKATLSIAAHDASTVIVRRNAQVSDILWDKARAEWGHEGDPARAIRVRVDAFLSNIDWLSSYCRRFETDVEWNDGARKLITRAGDERGHLDRIRKGLVPLAPAAVLARLSGGRFSRQLRAFQERDLGKLLALPNGANFSVPGAGKTTVTFALYEAERLAGKVDRLLVVAPLSAFESWCQEAVDCFRCALAVHRFSGGDIPDGAEVVLVNYQRLHRAYRAVSGWAQAGRCHVILDEAHRMKRGWSGQWGRASLNLAYYAARRDVLTGTPAPQGLRDLDAILDFAWPTQARRILPSALFDRTPPPSAAAQAGVAIRPLFVRTTKADLALRKPAFTVLEFPLEGLQRDIYTALRSQYAGKLALARSDRNMLSRMGRVAMYLLEAATNPSLLPLASKGKPARPRFPLIAVPQDGDLSDMVTRYPDFENPPKLVKLGAMIKANAEQGRKTLVWTNFVKNFSILEDMLRHYQPAIIHGGIPSEISAPNAPRTREAELHRFRSDPRCALLIANPAATSEGVSLHHDCHDAIYLDRTFNAGHYLQSIDRIHRLGMDPEIDTNITIMVTLGTIDVTVDAQVEQKAARLGAILSDDAIISMALPDDEDYKEVIAEEDLAALFAHLRGEDDDHRPVSRK